MPPLCLQRRTVRQRGEIEKAEGDLSPREVLRERIAKRAALEFRDGMYGILALPMTLYYVTCCTLIMLDTIVIVVLMM